jgi:hypothetical protein
MLSPRPLLRHEPLEISVPWVTGVDPGEAVHGVLIASQERQAPPTFQVGSLAELAQLGRLDKQRSMRASRSAVGLRTVSLLRLDGLDSRETGRMPLGWKLVIDSTNAPTLADFWAAALEYEVEDPSALVSQLLAAGHIGSEAVVEYRGRRIFRGYAAIRHPEDPFDETSGIGRGRRLLFQEVLLGGSPARIACTSASTVSPGASMSWLPGWRSWGQPAYARSMRDLQDAGG